MERQKARITVLKCMINTGIQEEFRLNVESTPCSRFKVGEVFHAGWDVPEGFCPSAWADIHNDLAMIQCGGSPGYIKPEHTMVSCCRDGLHPVVFKIERASEAC